MVERNWIRSDIDTISHQNENSQEVLDAKKRELNSLIENNGFNCV